MNTCRCLLRQLMTSCSICAVLLLAGLAAAEEQPLFSAGDGRYNNYRIPSLIVTTKGTVLAFAEGRSAQSDTGNIDIVMRRSTDGGRTWSPTQVIFDDGPNTVGNPCPVVDRNTGTIHMLLTWNLGTDSEQKIKDGVSKDTRRAWLSRSEDDGLSWSKPVDITTDVKPPDWTWYATGPGCGIQLGGGRLAIPCDHVTSKMSWGAHVIYSDDGGRSWQLGGVAGPGTNECQIVELRDGTLLLNMRNAEPARKKTGEKHRMISISRDRGMTWSKPSADTGLLEPICQAALIRWPGADRDLLIFSNPASTKREKMTVRLSQDGGRTWPHALQLHAGPAAYSALAAAGKDVLCLYERGQKQPYETITLARFPFASLQQAPASAPATRPAMEIVPRATWSDRPAMTERLKTHKPRLLTIHHAGVVDDGKTPGEQKMKGLLRFSQQEKKWGDVPYHFIIDRSGRVFEGRDLQFAPDTNTDYNVDGHIGICLNGDFTRQPVREEQYRALVGLLGQLAATLKIPDEGIATHQDYARTACPGSLAALVRDGTLRRNLAAWRAGQDFPFKAPALPATRAGG